MQRSALKSDRAAADVISVPFVAGKPQIIERNDGWYVEIATATGIVSRGPMTRAAALDILEDVNLSIDDALPNRDSIPPLREWRWPRFHMFREKHKGWQLFVNLHPNYNSVIFVARWLGKWDLQIFNWNIIGTKR